MMNYVTFSWEYVTKGSHIYISLSLYVEINGKEYKLMLHVTD